MRDAQKRNVEDTWQHLGKLLATIEPRECENYIRDVGYGSTSKGRAPIYVLLLRTLSA